MTNEVLQKVITLTNNYKKIIPRDICKKHKELDWGNNGIGDRWCKQLFNYTVIYSGNKSLKTYSDNDENLNLEIINNFKKNYTGTKKGIIGIFVHGRKTKNEQRPIRNEILKLIKRENCCEFCGSHSSLICDHKNDLYNDDRVLNKDTQNVDDFMCLCNRCNLLKRERCKKEKESGILYAAKNIPMFNELSKLFHNDEFPFEKKGTFNKNDITAKKGTFFHGPIDFCKNIVKSIKDKFSEKDKIIEEKDKIIEEKNKIIEEKNKIIKELHLRNLTNDFSKIKIN